jgi:predicted pyridoxine 5'-phosphate oxidase superfamily flavin-nucleotide-binding protein
MAKLPGSVMQAWEKRNGPVVLTTVDNEGTPNAIYATCVNIFDDETIVVADNYFDKTQKNIFAGSKGSILFITVDNKAFQVKGTIEYYKSGPVFENMKSWNPSQHPGNGAAALKVEEVFSGAERIL